MTVLWRAVSVPMNRLPPTSNADRVGSEALDSTRLPTIRFRWKAVATATYLTARPSGSSERLARLAKLAALPGLGEGHR